MLVKLTSKMPITLTGKCCIRNILIQYVCTMLVTIASKIISTNADERTFQIIACHIIRCKMLLSIDYKNAYKNKIHTYVYISVQITDP